MCTIWKHTLERLHKRVIAPPAAELMSKASVGGHGFQQHTRFKSYVLSGNCQYICYQFVMLSRKCYSGFTFLIWLLWWWSRSHAVAPHIKLEMLPVRLSPVTSFVPARHQIRMRVPWHVPDRRTVGHPVTVFTIIVWVPPVHGGLVARLNEIFLTADAVPSPPLRLDSTMKHVDGVAPLATPSSILVRHGVCTIDAPRSRTLEERQQHSLSFLFWFWCFKTCGSCCGPATGSSCSRGIIINRLHDLKSLG